MLCGMSGVSRRRRDDQERAEGAQAVCAPGLVVRADRLSSSTRGAFAARRRVARPALLFPRSDRRRVLREGRSRRLHRPPIRQSSNNAIRRRDAVSEPASLHERTVKGGDIAFVAPENHHAQSMRHAVQRFAGVGRAIFRPGQRVGMGRAASAAAAATIRARQACSRAATTASRSGPRRLDRLNTVDSTLAVSSSILCWRAADSARTPAVV